MIDVSSLFSQNPWWKDRELIKEDEKIKRAVNSQPQKTYSYKDENLMIMGPRQVGKTTFVKLAIRDLLLDRKVEPRNILYFSCDSLSNKEDILQLVKIFEEISSGSSKKYLFLDEITFVREWNVALLHLFNTGYFEKNRIYVTGSSSVSLQKETLPGRDIKKLIFYPLNFREFVDLFYKKLSSSTPKLENFDDMYRSAMDTMPYINELNRYLDIYMVQTGGFLSASYYYFQNKMDPFDKFYEVYRDSILSEISKLDRSEDTFKQVLNGIINNYGARYSANSIANKSSIGSHKTVESYQELMEKLFLTKTILNRNNGRIMYQGNKKTYLSDPFFYRVLSYYTGHQNIIDEKDKPKVLEGVVGMHLYRKFGDIFYFATKTGKEVDFIVNDVGVEVKYGNRDLRELNYDRGYLLTRDSIPALMGNRLSLPASLFLYLL
jgi:hypothetical protein